MLPPIIIKFIYDKYLFYMCYIIYGYVVITQNRYYNIHSKVKTIKYIIYFSNPVRKVY